MISQWLRWFCAWRFRRDGWCTVTRLPPEMRRCVLVAAPHTSNWDFIYGLAAYQQFNLPVHFTIKREWLRFPFNRVLEPLGAIGIDRSPKQPGSAAPPSMVKRMAELFQQQAEMVVLVTPEGTRKPVSRWHTGFYHLAVTAQVPIVLGYLDYAKKEVGIGPVLYPSGDMDTDLRQIYDFYNQIVPRYPQQFIKL